LDNKRETIMLVDDAHTNLIIGLNTLSDYYDVITMNSALKLLKMLERKLPDLVLLDVDMPQMNGYEALRQMKVHEASKDIPVIFLTTNSDNESELRGLQMGAVDYIIKPFTPALLRKRIEIHLLIQSQKSELMRFNENLQEMVDEKTQSVIELKNAVLKTVAELVEFRDDFTGGHIERTQDYLRLFIEAIKERKMYPEELASWDTELVIQSAQLHDVGKIAVDDAVLRKPGKLTAEEFDAIKKHAVTGGKIIDKIMESTSEHDFLEHAKILATSHHEKWNGTGYPYGIKGEEIPLQSRMMAIADVYDALVSARPYKTGMPHEKAVEIIKNDSGTHFDPKLVDLFLEISDEFERINIESNKKIRGFLA